MTLSKNAIYAGTFDPITNGHIDIIRRSLKVFPSLTIAIAEKPNKETLFSVEERKNLVVEVVSEFGSNINVETFDGLLVEYVRSAGSTVIIRGLRAVSDYEYEAQMATINSELASDIETVFFMTSADLSFVSSSVVKEVARNGGDTTKFVPKIVASALKRL